MSTEMYDVSTGYTIAIVFEKKSDRLLSAIIQRRMILSVALQRLVSLLSNVK